jgi:hypothetical protein
LNIGGRIRNEQWIALEGADDEVARLAGEPATLGQLQVALGPHGLMPRRQPAVDPLGFQELVPQRVHLISGQDVGYLEEHWLFSVLETQSQVPEQYIRPPWSAK